MTISLNPDTERKISEKISSGHYHSADEVVRQGLELLEEREKQTHPAPSNGDSNLAVVFETIASSVPDKKWETLPTDLSENLDHYLYGSDKKS